jgi:hypothetical protein
MAEVTWTDLKERVSKNALGAPTDALLQQEFNVSKAYVDHYKGVQTTVPEAVSNEAILTGGQELLKRSYNPQGSSSTLGAQGQPLPFPLSKDPFITVRALLDPYLVVGF